jgi:hypothetical protein
MELDTFKPLAQSILDFFIKAEKQFKAEKEWEEFIDKTLRVFTEGEFEILDKVYGCRDAFDAADYLHYYSNQNASIMKWLHKPEELQYTFNQIV